MLDAGSNHSAAVVSCAGLSLTDDERQLYREYNPVGFILFARNVEGPAQVRRLVDDLRDCIRWADAPVLIDQEGGRVARLSSPPWRAAPPALQIGALYESDAEAAYEAARLNGRLLAHDLFGLKINVNCAPVLDVLFAETHGIIGDRSFGGSPETIAALGRATCEGLLSGGVMPVIKHIPGHGRATLDSHEALPVVETPREELEVSDFHTFRLLADMPIAMTAHVIYSAIDAEAPATTSPTVIAEIIRGHIGFDGLLLSDDLSMKALSGDLATRTKVALGAGCDVVLHCNGDFAEMAAVLEACGSLTAHAVERVAQFATFLGVAEPLGDANERFEALMSGERR